MAAAKRLPTITLTLVRGNIEYVTEELTAKEAVKLLREATNMMAERVAREKRRCCK